MFSLTKKTDYALIALTYLVKQPRNVVNARAIADRYRVPPALLMNVLKSLAHHGLIGSLRGAKGGYCLSKPASDISLYDVIVAVEGPVRMVQCAGESQDDSDTCGLTEVCPVSAATRRIHHRLELFLKDVSLAEISADACTCDLHDVASASVPLGVGTMESKA